MSAKDNNVKKKEFHGII